MFPHGVILESQDEYPVKDGKFTNFWGDAEFERRFERTRGSGPEAVQVC